MPNTTDGNTDASFILASGNDHKAMEFSGLFSSSRVKIIAAEEKIDVIEDGETFRQNALLKAQAYFKQYNRPVMADDSGLVINNIPEIMGIHSARFGSAGSDFPQKCRELIDLLDQKKLLSQDERSAYFVCVLCFYVSENEIFYFEGKLTGHIGNEAQGDQGFGYDPIFIPSKLENKTLAEDPDWKSLNSHRCKAVNTAIKFFDKRN